MRCLERQQERVGKVWREFSPSAAVNLVARWGRASPTAADMEFLVLKGWVRMGDELR